MVILRYLGAAGWHIKTDETSIVIDPYFTRVSMWQVLFSRLVPNETLIACYMPPAQAIFVTHAHYDHLMDVPEASHLTQATVYGSPQTFQIAQILGLPYKHFQIVRPGESLRIGDFDIDVYFSVHRRIFGRIPAHGLPIYGARSPLRMDEYRMDMLYSLRLRIGNLSVLIASGLDQEPQVETDILLFGADASDEQLARVLQTTKPRLVIPNHWDDMFISLDRPARPMIIPPRTQLPSLKRIDVRGFAQRVKRIRPDSEVMVPERFSDIPLADKIVGGKGD